MYLRKKSKFSFSATIQCSNCEMIHLDLINVCFIEISLFHLYYNNFILHGLWMKRTYGSLLGGFAIFRIFLLLSSFSFISNFSLYIQIITPSSWILGYILVPLFLKEENISKQKLQ